jgi:hypothetical protein
MNVRILGLAAGMMVFSLAQAEAKTVDMGSISRSDVSNACKRAGGASFGIGTLEKSYGCSTAAGSVYCTAEGDCVARVLDTVPMIGNSLDYVLTRGQNGPAASMIQPKDHSIHPLSQPPR